MIRIAAYIFIVISLWLPPKVLIAQMDTLDLARVEIVGERMRQDIAVSDFEKIAARTSPLSATSTFNNLLSNGTNLVLRGYGPGSSFGISIRGSSTSQTQVMINGIPFENPGLATSDISLLANGIYSDVSIYRGSGAAYLGNGSVGGSVLLNSGKPVFDETISQNLSVGSFGNFGSLTEATYGKKRFAGSTGLYFQEAQNDFLRTDPADRSKLTPQPNAAFKTKGLAQDFYLYSKGATSAKFFLWASETDREIPPVKSRQSAKTGQKDQSFRAQAIVSTSVKSVDLEFNTAVDHGFLNYKDPAASLDENSEYTSIHFQGEARRDFGKTHVFVFGIFHDSFVLTEAYSKTQQRISPAIVAGARRSFWSDATLISLLLRQEFLNSKPLPVVPIFSLRQKLNDNLSLELSAGRAYRLPGLNDLFWVPGGNPDLKPESGWFQEAGIHYLRKYDAAKIEAKITAFHRVIDNWIQWIPSANYWSPRNVKSVRSQGIDANFEISYPVGKIHLSHSFSATLAESVSLDPMFFGDRSVNKQLIYIPLWSAFAKEEVGFFKNRLSIAVLGKYFSERYTTADNSSGLDPYLLIDVEVNGSVNLKNTKFSVFGAVRNIFDVEYQLQAAYPMPGIYFETGIKFNINLKQENHEK